MRKKWKTRTSIKHFRFSYTLHTVTFFLSLTHWYEVCHWIRREKGLQVSLSWLRVNQPREQVTIKHCIIETVQRNFWLERSLSVCLFFAAWIYTNRLQQWARDWYIKIIKTDFSCKQFCIWPLLLKESEYGSTKVQSCEGWLTVFKKQLLEVKYQRWMQFLTLNIITSFWCIRLSSNFTQQVALYNIRKAIGRVVPVIFQQLIPDMLL